MRTTIEISDALLAEAKSVARERGIPLRQLIEEGLRAILPSPPARKRRFRLKDGSFGPGTPARELSWVDVRGLIYDGRGE